MVLDDENEELTRGVLGVVSGEWIKIMLLSERKRILVTLTTGSTNTFNCLVEVASFQASRNSSIE